MVTKMKHFRKKLLLRLIHLVLVFIVTNACSAREYIEQDEASNISELDNSITHGRLSNGLTYFIKPLPDRKSGIHMEFIHLVGANQEDPDQQNFAHAVEHLAFKPTKNFPSGIFNSELLESLGGDFKINAGNAKNYTSYQFSNLEGSLEGVKAGFLWFRDIVDNLELNPQNIESVRGEVREELLSKVGTEIQERIASAKLDREFFPCAAKEVDLVGHHEKFSTVDLRRFYQDWYHPKNFALVIVGDINDPDEMLDLIKDYFSKLKSPEYARELKNCDSLYYSLPPQFAVVKRNKDQKRFLENKTASIDMILRHPSLKQSRESIEGLKELKKYELLLDILNDRFLEASKDYGFNLVETKPFFLVDELPRTRLTYSFEDGAGKKSIMKIGELLNQLRSHGISESEFDSVKNKFLTQTKEITNSPVRYWTNEIKMYLQGEPLPKKKNDYLFQYLENLTRNELNNFIAEHLNELPEDIGIIAPEGHEALSFQENVVRGWITEAYNSTLVPYEEPEVRNLLSSQEIEALKPIGSLDKGVDETGSRVFILNNGIKLVLQQENQKDSNSPSLIHLHGFSVGGANLLPEEDYWSAINAPSIIYHSGVNGMTKFEIDRILYRTGLYPGVVSSYIDYSDHGIYGRATLENFEAVMQLVYLYFTQPNRKKKAFEDWKLEFAKSYLDPSGDLYQKDFSNTFRSVTGDKYLKMAYNKKVLPGGTDQYQSIQETQFEKAHDIYNQFFGDGKDFTFLISGNFEVDKILRMAEKYLGNLPTSCFPKFTEASEETLPEGPSMQIFTNKGNYKMENYSYGTFYLDKVKDMNDWQEHIKVDVLGEVLRQKIWDLRFKKGYGIYGPSGHASFKPELQRYEFRTYLSCQPKDFHNLQREVKDIYADLRAGKITSSELKPALELYYLFNFSNRAHVLGIQARRIYEHYRFNQPWVDEKKAKAYVMELTAEDLQRVAQKYLKEENFHELVIRDE